MHAPQPLSPPPSRPRTTEEIDQIFDEREQRGIWGYGVFYNTITGRREVVPQPIQELHNFIHIQMVLVAVMIL